jgi:Domain of unknown function (DUF4180)
MIEGPRDQPWLTSAADCKTLVEACASARSQDALLHPTNLPPGFFDLSTGVAGDCLQKWRNYRIRVAVLCPPDSVAFSSRFPEMVEEESRKGYFRIFEAREPAIAWLEDVGDQAGGG